LVHLPLGRSFATTVPSPFHGSMTQHNSKCHSTQAPRSDYEISITSKSSMERRHTHLTQHYTLHIIRTITSRGGIGTQVRRCWVNPDHDPDSWVIQNAPLCSILHLEHINPRNPRNPRRSQHKNSQQLRRHVRNATLLPSFYCCVSHMTPTVPSSTLRLSQASLS
jgi:hypothetical protein